MTSAAPDLKLLLDQNFPHPVFDLSAVDATVSVTPLRVFDASLTRRKTPDWLIYLRASQAGFDAVVTRDRSQLDDPEELATLVDTGLNVITWRHPVEDSIQEWGQLLAYMSLIRRRLAGQRSQVIQLPKPSLGSGQIAPARALLGEIASARSMAYPDVRREARRVMRDELASRGLNELAEMVRDD